MGTLTNELQAQLTDSSAWATATVDAAHAQLTSVTDFIAKLHPPSVNGAALNSISFSPGSIYSPTEFVVSNAPKLSTFTSANLPTAPAAPQLQSLPVAPSTALTLDNIVVQRSGSAPTAPNAPGSPQLPTIPSAFAGTLPAPPVTNGVVAPAAAPTVDTILAPSLQAVTLPTAPVVALPAPPSAPTLNALSAPTISLQASNDLGGTAATLMEPIVVTALTNGVSGVGLAAATDAAAWRRSADRAAAKEVGVARDLTSKMAGMGFRVPNGALVASIANASRDAARVSSDESLTATVEELKLVHGDAVAALSSAVSFDRNLRTSMDAFADRSLDVAKSVANFSMDVYRGTLEQRRIEFEGWRGSIDMYKAQLTAELSKLDVFKTEVEAATLGAKLNTEKVRTYAVQVDASKIGIDIYRAEVDAYSATMRAEAIKFDIYKSQIDGFTATIAAKSSEYAGYRAQVDGELAKVKVYEGSVAGYSSAVKAYSEDRRAAMLEAEILAKNNEYALQNAKLNATSYKMSLDAGIATNDDVLKAYGMLVQDYTIAVQGTLGQDRTALNAFTSSQSNLINAFNSAEAARMSAHMAVESNRVNASIADSNASITAFRTNAEVSLKQAELELAAAKATAELNLKTSEVGINASVSMSEITSGMAKAAMQGRQVVLNAGQTFLTNQPPVP